MENIKIFCSHHRPLHNRKTDTINAFGKFSFDVTFIEDYEFGRDLHENPTKLNNSQYSVMLKHYKMFEIMVEQNIEYAFIIEDDLIIPEDFDLRNFFQSIVEQRGNCNIIFFGSCCDLYVENPIEGVVVYPGYSRSRCGHGYFVDLNYARKISENKRFDKTGDHLMMDYIKDFNFVSAWTHPCLLQKSERKIIASSLT